MKSWKTTIAGILAVLIAIMQALVALWDADAATSPDWAIIGTTLMAAIGLFAARDNDKTSEDVDAG